MINTVSKNENIETYLSKSSSANKHRPSVNKTSNAAEETIDAVAKTENERTSSSTSAFNKRKRITTIEKRSFAKSTSVGKIIKAKR